MEQEFTADRAVSAGSEISLISAGVGHGERGVMGNERLSIACSPPNLVTLLKVQSITLFANLLSECSFGPIHSALAADFLHINLSSDFLSIRFTN